MSGTAVALAASGPRTRAAETGRTVGPPAAAIRRAEEAEWITAVSRGDAEALRLLWTRYRRPCLQIARGTLGGETHIEDVVQLVFLDVWRHAGRYDPSRASAGSWILSLAHHKAVDRVRHERARSTLSLELPYTLPKDAASGGDLADGVVRRHMVRRAVDGLRPKQRQVLLLSYFDDLTYAEIAALLHVPLGTIKTRGLAGMQALRARLTELGEADEGD